MEAIILGSQTGELYNDVDTIVVPAYQAEEAVIELSDGYNPYIVGGGSSGTGESYWIRFTNGILKPSTTSNRVVIGASTTLGNESLRVAGKGLFDSVQLGSGVYINNISIDGTLAGNSDTTLSTEKAIKTYVDSKVSTSGGLKAGDNISLLNNNAGYITSSDVAPVLKNELTVNLGVGGSVGGVTTGTTYAAGTTLESIIDAILTKQVLPTYISPTITISSTPSTSGIEIGTNISITLSSVFTQNDAGSATATTYKKNSVALSGSTDSIQVTDTAVNYTVIVDYNEGVIKNDNLGTPYPTGHITAGSITSSAISYIGYRNIFYGFDTLPSSSSVVRSFSGRLLNGQNGTTFSIVIPVGTTRVSFCYPATLRDVSSVKYVQGMNAEIKNVFTSGTVNVEGANSYTAISYKTYTYAPAVAFSQTATYNVTI